MVESLIELTGLSQEVAALHLPDSDALADRFTFHPSNNLASPQRHAQALRNLNFGRTFGDHMALAKWEPGRGWYDKKVVEFGPLQLSPASAVFHYAQEIFEGLKAFRWADGSVWTFRPGFNAARFNCSAKRMAMPQLDVLDFVGSLVTTVRADKRWVPTADNTSLYLRPFMIADEEFLGVSAASNYLYALISSPVGPYFADGVAPVSIWVSKDFHRAAPGGTGDAKTGGNYATSLLPQQLAARRGYEQVLYLDAKTSTCVEELGGMNVFVVYKDGTVRTPRLTGTILEGGTRFAIISLLQDRGIKVEEVNIRLDDLVHDIRRGHVVEMFACGTAAVITPINRLGSTDFELTVSGTRMSMSLLDELTGIQRGTLPDKHGWMYCLTNPM